MASTLEQLKDLLKAGKVRFEYTKVNGDIREAVGTLNGELIPDKFAENSNPVHKITNLRYFDLDKQSWRSISKDTKEVEIFD